MIILYNVGMKLSVLVIALLIAIVNAVSANDELPPVRPGDVVISINGKKMKNNLAAIKTLNSMKPKAHVVMEVLRDNRIQKIVYDVK